MFGTFRVCNYFATDFVDKNIRLGVVKLLKIML